MNVRDDDRHAYQDAVERLGNLLEAAAARGAMPASADLDDGDLQTLANLIGPILAGLQAARVCGELLAQLPAVHLDVESHAGSRLAADNLGDASASEIAASPQRLIEAMRDLIQIVAQDIGDLGALALSDEPGPRRTPSDREITTEWHWIKVGTNPVYAAVAGGEVAALVYRTDEELGTDDDGAPIVTSPGWFWFSVDGSDRHHEVQIEGPLLEKERGSLDPLDDAALDAASAPIERFLAERGRRA